MDEEAIEAVRGRYERGVGWVPGKHWAAQADEDVRVMLAAYTSACQERDEARSALNDVINMIEDYCDEWIPMPASLILLLQRAYDRRPAFVPGEET